MRRITSVALVVASLVLALGVTPPASAAPARIVLATSTPGIDAGGRAVFAVKGLPSGTAYLQWFNPTTKKWQRKATVRHKGSVGTASASGLPQGVNRFRVVAGSRTSNSTYVKAYGIYTFDEFNKTHAFGANTMAARDLYLTSRVLQVPDGFGCELVDLGLEMISPQPTWAAEIAALSATEPDPVIQINELPAAVPLASVVRASVSGPIALRFLASTSNSQPFFGWVGVQVHCLADPGI